MTNKSGFLAGGWEWEGVEGGDELAMYSTGGDKTCGYVISSIGCGAVPIAGIGK